MTTATILADSVSGVGVRLTTFQVRAPRFILPQLSKHRNMSISCRSSRAVPVAKMIAEVQADPVIPRFGRNAKGMQARKEIDGYDKENAHRCWLDARDFAVSYASELVEYGVAKETCNRLLENFGWFDAVISATSYDNFFALRIHPDSQHEIRELALAMARAYRASDPTLRWRPYDWHLPYVMSSEREKYEITETIDLSSARCGRVSYTPHDEATVNTTKDFARAEGFKTEGHWVPWEHQAKPLEVATERSGNFVGWAQARQVLLRPNVHEAFDWSILDAYETQRE